MTIEIRTDRRLIRADRHSERFVLVRVTAPAAPRDRRARAPVNLAFVLDRSGSMGGQKIRLARRAVEESLARLHADDRFSLVVYDDRVDVVVEGTQASAEARAQALARLAAIDARGSTNLAEGWLRGCEQVAAELSAGGIDRCLLLTDGLANVGITDGAELERYAGDLRARGVQTTTFGVGEDFDEQLLQRMAVVGGGHFYYIEMPAQITDHVTSEVGETLDVVAHEAVLHVTAPEAVTVQPLTPVPSQAQGARTVISLGDLVSEQQIEVVLRLRFPHGASGTEIGALFALSARNGVVSGESAGRVAWTYADDAANDRQPRDRDVDRAVARLFAARARQEAAALNRSGDFAGAQQRLGLVAERITGYAGDDAELGGMAAALRDEAVRWAAPACEPARKRAFAASYNLAHSRTVEGRARRPSGGDNGA